MDYSGGPSSRLGEKLPPVSEIRFDAPDSRRPQPYTFGSHGGSITSAPPQSSSYPTADSQRDMSFRPSPIASPQSSRRPSDEDDRARQAAIRPQLPPIGELFSPAAHHPLPNAGPYPHSSLPPSHNIRAVDPSHSPSALHQPGEPSRIADPAYRTPPPPAPYPEDGYNRGPPPYTNGHGPAYPPQADRQPSYAYPPSAPHFSNPPVPPTSYPAQYHGPEAGYSNQFRVLGKRTERYGQVVERALAVSDITREIDVMRNELPKVNHGLANLSEAALNRPDQYMRDLDGVENSLKSMTQAITNAKKHAINLVGRDSEEGRKPEHMPYSKSEDSYYSNEPSHRNAPASDTKRIRRGRPAPPGRCHSCNRSETPEWRRGPDGARTLCNACGLHFAKISRKNSKQQVASS